MRSLALGSLLVLACGAPPPPTFGLITLPSDGKNFTIVKDGQALLAPYAGTDAYAPVAWGKGRATWEAKYGAFKINELATDWRASTRFSWETVTKEKALGSYRDQNGIEVARVEASAPAEGELSLKYSTVDPAMNRLSLAFGCNDADHFAGFGAQADGIDHKGHTVGLWMSEPGIGKNMEDDSYPPVWFLTGTRHASSYALPTWVSNRGYQGVIEANERSVYELCSKKSDAMRIEVWANHFTFWVFTGAKDVLPLTQATGRVLGRPMQPPAVAFAPWNDAIFGSAEVRRVAKALRDNDVPSSVIWTEDFRGGMTDATGYRLKEEWVLDRALYPDAEQLVTDLTKQGFGWHAYFNSFLVEGEQVFAAAQAGNHFVKNAMGQPYLFAGVTFKPTGLADVSRPETREFIKSYFRQALDLGFTGWMSDFAEWLPHDAVLANGADPLEYHARYAHEYHSLSHEVLAERTDGVPRLFFARSGWLRSNEVTPVVWAGDQRTSFQADDGMPTVIPMGLGLGLGGVSTFGSDVAGYQSNSATNPPSTKELFFRWVELGALSPVMRTHHGIDAANNWRWDKDADTITHYRRWAKFHVQLFPYLDGASVEAETKGIPLMRALLLMFPKDLKAWTVSDEFMLGPSLLVAPVQTEGATRRTVHLPDGEWLALDGTGHTKGPTELDTSAPLTELPIFVRAGGVVPRLPERIDSLLPADAPIVDLDDVKNERVVLVALGGDGSFTERDGATYTLTKTADATGYKENGVALGTCATATQRGCIDRTLTRPKVRMTGSEVDLPGHHFTAPAGKKVDVEVLE